MYGRFVRTWLRPEPAPLLDVVAIDALSLQAGEGLLRDSGCRSPEGRSIPHSFVHQRVARFHSFGEGHARPLALKLLALRLRSGIACKLLALRLRSGITSAERPRSWRHSSDKLRASPADETPSWAPDPARRPRTGATTSVRPLPRRTSNRFQRRHARVCLRRRTHSRRAWAANASAVLSATTAASASKCEHSDMRALRTSERACCAPSRQSAEGPFRALPLLPLPPPPPPLLLRQRACSRVRRQLTNCGCSPSWSRFVALSKLRIDSVSECFCTWSTMKEGTPTVKFSEIASSTVMRVRSWGSESNFHIWHGGGGGGGRGGLGGECQSSQLRCVCVYVPGITRTASARGSETGERGRDGREAETDGQEGVPAGCSHRSDNLHPNALRRDGHAIRMHRRAACGHALRATRHVVRAAH